MESLRLARRPCLSPRMNSETAIFQAAMFTQVRLHGRSEWRLRSFQKTCRGHMPVHLHMALSSYAPLL